MLRNIKYESFGAGRAGRGQIDLLNGEMVFVHDDTESDSILPISVSHVYSTVSALDPNGSAVCGKGFKLNVHQKLRKMNDDPNDTRYVFTDAAGKEFDFKKLYYYRDLEGKKVYHKTIDDAEIKLTPEDICIDLRGKLTYNDGNETHEIFTEQKTDSGLILITELKGFRNAEKIETRREELIHLEEDVRSLERSIEDLEFSMEEYEKFDREKYSKLKELQDNVQNLSLDAEKKGQDSFNDLINSQDELIGLNSSYNDLIDKEFHDIGRLVIKNGNVEISGETVANDNKNGVSLNYNFNFDPNRPRFTYKHEIGKIMEKLSLLASYDEEYTDDHYGAEINGTDVQINSMRIKRVIQFLQERFNEHLEEKSQDIRKKSFTLEQKRWEDQKALMEMKDSLLETQATFKREKDKYDNAEEERTKKRYAVLEARAELDIIVARNMLEYRRFMLRQYEEQVSVNFISDGNLTYGFNRTGDLVIVWDAYENHASLIYENGKLIEITDAEEKETVFEYIDDKLSAIVDTLDRRIEFIYDEDFLETIIYPNGDGSTFTYRNGLLCDMLPPVGIGTRLEYNSRNMPSKIVNITLTESITSDGATESDETETEDVAEITYNTNGASTVVTDIKTNCRTTCLFNSEGDCVTEYAELDRVMKMIRTYDDGHRRCYFSMQQTDFDNNLFDHAIASEENDPAVILSPNGDVMMRDNIPAPNRFAEWYLDPNHLPEHATDLILSGFAVADSDETMDRRRTEYCDHSDHNHSHASPVTDPSVKDRRFELRAEIVYLNGSTNESEIKTFIASYDWKVRSRQFTAIPITLNEDENGKPIKPSSIKITADYSNNGRVCLFSGLSLADGTWTYAETDDERRKIFECGNRNITDRTFDGISAGKFISYGKSFFEYDAKGNLTKERAVLTRDGVSEEYVTRREYNKRSKLIRTISPNGIVSETIYDKRGTAVRSFSYHRSNPAKKLVRENEYNEKGQPIAEIDARGENKTIFEYLNGTNIVTETIAPNGQKFSIGTDPHTDELSAISASVHGESNETEFVHTKGLLTRLTSNGTSYEYDYDNWGRKIAISVDGTPHVRFAFGTDGNGSNNNNDGSGDNGNNNGDGNNNGNDIVTATYANGEQYQTVTDRFGKLLTVRRIADGIERPFITNHYNKDGILIGTADHHADKVTEFIYNPDGSVNTEMNGNVRTIRDHNIEGSVRKVRYVLSENINDQIYENIYDNEDRVTRIILPGGRSETIEYDALGRISAIDRPVHREKINYYQNGDNATTLITSVEYDDRRTKYAYDRNGNISEIRENGRLSVRYSYDGLDRIVREDNVRLNRSTTFDYDTNGNIRTKNTYPLSDPIDLISGEEIRYDYAKTGNRDRLTTFNGEACEYDLLGNPIIYRNNELKWENLKDLTRYNDVKFEYDAFGLRQKKKHNGTETRFYWSGSKLIAEKRISGRSEDLELNDHLADDRLSNDHLTDDHLTDDPAYSNATVMNISYLQGAGGLAGFIISKNGGSYEEPYYYRKNILGDITHIFDNDGNVKAEYVYDAWGNHEIIEDDDRIGSLNPHRYRGYYYDNETNLYYLRTRYYDPETGRFINADDIAILDETKTSINGLNLYAYCNNNPIMFIDPTGQIWGWIDNTFIRPIGNAIDSAVNWVSDNATGIALIAMGTVFCFVPGLQMLGVSLIVAGGLMLLSSGLATAGVDNRIISGINIAAGAILCFVPGMQYLGTSIILSEIGGIVGGHIGEALGFGYETGAMAGGTIGSVAGGKFYNNIRFSKISKQGVVIGKGNVERCAIENGYAWYSGMTGYNLIRRISPSAANRLGWANNHHYIRSVMRRNGNIYDKGGVHTNSYKRELDLLFVYRFLIKV